MARIRALQTTWAVLLLLPIMVEAQSKLPAEAVATVNGEAISKAEFDLLWSRVPSSPTPLTAERRKSLQRELLGRMLDDVLFKQFLRNHVPPADERLVQQRMSELEKGLKAKQRTLKQFAAENSVTETRLRADVAASVQWNAYVQQRLKEGELEQFYKDNQALFDGTSVRASQLFLPAPRAADAKAHQEALRKMQGIRQEIAGGLAFADAAKKYSQDGSAASGGDIGYFPPTRIDKDPFMRAVAVLKVGQTSDIVQTDYGYHLIVVTDRKVGTPTTFSQVKEEVRMLLADELRTQLVAEQRKNAKIEVRLPE